MSLNSRLSKLHWPPGLLAHPRFTKYPPLQSLGAVCATGQNIGFVFATRQDLGAICADEKIQGTFSASRQRPNTICTDCQQSMHLHRLFCSGLRLACVHTLQNALLPRWGRTVSEAPLAPRSNGDQLKAWSLR